MQERDFATVGTSVQLERCIALIALHELSMFSLNFYKHSSQWITLVTRLCKTDLHLFFLSEYCWDFGHLRTA